MGGQQSGGVVADKMDHSKVHDEAHTNLKTWRTGADEEKEIVLIPVDRSQHSQAAFHCE